MIDKALAPFNGSSLVGMVDVYNEPGEKMRTAELPMQQLSNITVGELLASGYGTNLIIHVEGNDVGMSTPSSVSVTAVYTLLAHRVIVQRYIRVGVRRSPPARGGGTC